MVSGMDFIDIRPAIAIIVLDYNLLPYTEYHNKYRLKNTRNNDELTDVFEINFLELKKVKKGKKNSLKELWMLFLKAEKEETLEMLANADPVMEKAVNKLIYVSADEKLRYELDMLEKAELDYWSAMKTNYRKGKEKGREEGREEGIEKVAKNLLNVGVPIEKIIIATGLTIAEVEKLHGAD